MQKHSQNERRKLIQCLSQTLREFGLIDRFGLCDLFLSPVPPTRSSVCRTLNEKRGLLPHGVPADFIASRLLERCTVFSLHSRPSNDLLSIPAGPSAANKYHIFIFKAISWIFHDQLVDGKIEAEINEGRKRIDIVFRNAAKDGFFDDLSRVYRIHCPIIPIECKNYSDDVGNPEFDQLAERFDEDRGNFGILICRKIIDKSKTLKTCRDKKNSGRGFVVVMEDTDVVRLLDLDGDKGEINTYMFELLNKILM